MGGKAGRGGQRGGGHGRLQPATNRIIDDEEEQRESKRRKPNTGEAVPGEPTGELGLLLQRYGDEDSHQPETSTGCGGVKGDQILFGENVDSQLRCL